MFWLVFQGTHPNKTLIMFFLRSTSPLLSTTHHILCCRLVSPRILAEEPCTKWYPHLFHFPGCPSLAVIWQIQSQPIWPHSLAEGCSGPWCPCEWCFCHKEGRLPRRCPWKRKWHKVRQWDLGAWFFPRGSYVWRGLLFASFHEDVDVVAGLWEVDEVDDVGVLYLLSNDDLGLNSLDDVHFEFFPGLLVPFLLGDLCSRTSTCLSSYCFDIILQAKPTEGLPRGQAA